MADIVVVVQGQYLTKSPLLEEIGLLGVPCATVAYVTDCHVVHCCLGYQSAVCSTDYTVVHTDWLEFGASLPVPRVSVISAADHIANLTPSSPGQLPPLNKCLKLGYIQGGGVLVLIFLLTVISDVIHFV